MLLVVTPKWPRNRRLLGQPVAVGDVLEKLPKNWQVLVDIGHIRHADPTEVKDGKLVQPDSVKNSAPRKLDADVIARNVAKMNVRKLRETITTINDREVLKAIHDAEFNGEGRKSALKSIEERIAALIGG